MLERIIGFGINEGSLGRAAILADWTSLVGIDTGGLWVIVVCAGMGDVIGDMFVWVGTAVKGLVVVGKDSVIVIAVCAGSGDEAAGRVFIAETSPLLS
jgi:hypothetical protein